MLTLKAFLTGRKERIVYCGGRITEQYIFDAFCMSQLFGSGSLVRAKDIRDRLSRPTYGKLKAAVQKHYRTIHKYAQATGRNLYSFGLFLDISRCLYTLRAGKILSKTQVGQWALQEKLCPRADVLERESKL